MSLGAYDIQGRCDDLFRVSTALTLATLHWILSSVVGVGGARLPPTIRRPPSGC